MELETVQSVLQDAGIDVDLHALQNPTEKFMVQLVTEYLKKFNIDGNKIAKPTPEQLDRVSDEDSALNAIQAINLHAALAKICEGIFLKDLTLTDITSPGCKKTCKRIKVLFNFFVYVRNKLMENEHFFAELEDRMREIEEMKEKNAQMIAKTGAVISERENKLEYIEKLKREIEEVTMKMESDKNIRQQLQVRVEEVTAKQQEKLLKFNALKAKAYELNQETKVLQSKIVQSPEKIVNRSQELKKLLEAKKEERSNVNNSISSKKNQIQKNELAEAEVKRCFSQVKDLAGGMLQKLKETALQVNDTKRQLNEIKAEIASLEQREKIIENNDSGNDIDPEEFEKSQRLLSQLHYSHAEKEREHGALRKKLDELQIEYKNKKAKLQKEREQLAVAEKDYRDILQKLKYNLDSKISEEKKLRQNIEDVSKSK